jgi:hypothetical protein
MPELPELPELTEFDDIRPYHDEEVDLVLAGLLENREFLDFLARFRLKRLSAIWPGLGRTLVRLVLRRQFRRIHSIRDFQLAVASYAKKLVAETMNGFTCEGLEQLDPQQAYLFMGNHRDIAGDSMLLDYALHLAGRETVRIAVGDNLVQRQFATDLMKLNKSFLIRRSQSGAKKVYAALLESSRYIHASIKSGNSVWIAQAEGRAKDGIDLTDPALVKMLALAERKQDLHKTIADLRVVPVAIAYEYDPCDLMKARELHGIAVDGSYQKAPGEDLLSLVKGLGEFKGKVTLRFGRPLDQPFEIPEQVAAEIDRQVLDGLQLYQINYWALAQLAALAERQVELRSEEQSSSQPEPLPGSLAEQQVKNDAELAQYLLVWQHVGHLAALDSESILTQRFAECPVAHQRQWLQMYANPVVNKFNHGAANLAPV